MMDEILTVKQVCSRLHVGKTKLYEMLARGDLPSVRIGRQIRIPESALQSWIESQAYAPVDRFPRDAA